MFHTHCHDSLRVTDGHTFCVACSGGRGTRCISSFLEKENAKENVMEMTNFINTFIVLDILIGI